jgi:hypothetical protein
VLAAPSRPQPFGIRPHGKFGLDCGLDHADDAGALDTSTGFGATWQLATTDAAFSPSGWTVGPRTQSNDAGGTWLVPRGDGRLLLRLEGPPSPPEPASLTLLGLDFAAVGVGRWWRRKQVASRRAV